MVSRRVVLASVGAVVALGLLSALATGGLAGPTVDSTDSEWGDVTAETTEIRTDVTVSSAGPVGLPGGAGVTHRTRLNDVTLAEGTAEDVDVGSGTTTVALTAEVDNDRMADWWVTHVNGGERSELAVDTEVDGPGIGGAAATHETTVETDVAGEFAADGERTVELAGEPFVVLSDQRAEWGEATAETTPLRIRADVENVHDYPVTLDGVEYVVTSGGVELGQGQQTAELDVGPGERGALDVTVELDTPKMAEWWAGHVRNGEESDLTVRMYGVVEEDGERRRVPLRLYDRRVHLETDLLGDGTAAVRGVDGPAEAETFERPTVTEHGRQWGRVTDDSTEMAAAVVVDTPDSDVVDLLSLWINQTTVINDVQASNDANLAPSLEPGSHPMNIATRIETGTVPTWWARHLNQGETSTITVRNEGTLDLGATKLDVPIDDRTTPIETDMLAGMNGDADEAVTAGGETALVVEETTAEWGEATPEEAPIETGATVRNERDAPVEVTDVHYTVEMNGVVLADRTAPDSYVLEGGERRTLPVTMRLDNGRMDEWWVSHVRQFEESYMEVTVEATVVTGGDQRRVTLDSLGQSRTVETNVTRRLN